MTQSQIEQAIAGAVLFHNKNLPLSRSCWSWGARSVMGDHQICFDCKKKAGHEYGGGIFRCWRCAFWFHMARAH